MNRDAIIRMAREAGIVVTGEAVWKLCELVVAAERQRQQLTDEQISDLWHQSGEQPFKFARMLLK